ncbi:hypothetical protein BH10ACI3_BH10ACI3_24590 [soil metagenome]
MQHNCYNTSYRGDSSTKTMEICELEQPVEDGDLDMRPAGEWLDEAGYSEPKTLLGELWHEGEMAVLFGDTSSGKSLLAVQVAESIARGVAMEPFEMTAEAQKVLLLDLGGSAMQFRRRYTSEPDGDEPARKYEFSPNLIRVSLKGAVQIAPAKIAAAVEKTGAKVLVIDSLAFLQKYSLPRETVVVMRELRRLQKRFGLSILVLMNTARYVNVRGIIAADIPCASVVTSYADNIFAVGRSGSRSSVRYLKHIKSSLNDATYGAAHVPYFAIMREGGNFPSFQHTGYASEAAVRANDDDHWEWQRIRDIQKLAEQQKPIRDIAEELGLTRSTVHRLLSMAGDAPPLPTPAAVVGERVKEFFMREKCIVNGCHGCPTCVGRAARSYAGIPGTLITGHDNSCPDDCDMCGPTRYAPGDTDVDPQLKLLSENHYKALRRWLLSNKEGPRPVYPMARRYGHEKAGWKPGSENWTEEQLNIYDRWRRVGWETNAPEPDFNPRAGP